MKPRTEVRGFAAVWVNHFEAEKLVIKYFGQLFANAKLGPDGQLEPDPVPWLPVAGGHVRPGGNAEHQEHGIVTVQFSEDSGWHYERLGYAGDGKDLHQLKQTTAVELTLADSAADQGIGPTNESDDTKPKARKPRA